MADVVLVQLVEQPGQVVHVAVRGPVGQRGSSRAGRRTAGRSRCRSSRSSPTPPGRRPARVGSTALILPRVVEDLVADLVHRRARPDGRRGACRARCSARCPGGSTCRPPARRRAPLARQDAAPSPAGRSSLAATLASLGSLPVTCCPCAAGCRCRRRGTTASRLPVCAPYLAMEKLRELAAVRRRASRPSRSSGWSASPARRRLCCWR